MGSEPLPRPLARVGIAGHSADAVALEQRRELFDNRVGREGGLTSRMQSNTATPLASQCPIASVMLSALPPRGLQRPHSYSIAGRQLPHAMGDDVLNRLARDECDNVRAELAPNSASARSWSSVYISAISGSPTSDEFISSVVPCQTRTGASSLPKYFA